MGEYKEYESLFNDMVTSAETSFRYNILEEKYILSSLSKDLLQMLSIISDTFVKDEELKKCIIDVKGRSYKLIKNIENGGYDND